MGSPRGDNRAARGRKTLSKVVTPYETETIAFFKTRFLRKQKPPLGTLGQETMVFFSKTRFLLETCIDNRQR